MWVVGVCVTQAASIACGEGNPTQKEDDYQWGGWMWMGVDGWMDGSEYIHVETYNIVI